MNIKSNLSIATLLAGLAITTSAAATNVTGGEFILDFDEAGLLSLSNEIVNVGWFDSVASADKTPQEMREASPSEDIPDTFNFKVFGATIPTPPAGLQDRAPQVSTFEYDGDPTTGTGIIGLAGVHVIASKAGGMSMGDYGLSYDASRIGNSANSSGWFITNYHAFQLTAFDLTHVEVTIIDANNFSLSGDVVLAGDLGLMLSATEGTDVGDFTFTTMTDGNASPAIDGSIANYSFTTELLTLPTVLVGEDKYSVVLRSLALANGQFAFELKSAELTAMSADVQAEFDIETGLLTVPEVSIVGNAEFSGKKLLLEMQLEHDHFPSRFIFTNAQVVDE